ncbi:hypothetical protein [Bifidobacterium callitrichos]|uniref:Uncharacterized protein n=1 Tax=Bifidobacterium callitrichos DSM 23973 TaxID=1437609 RepID=A0A087A183_9BIFI|nr:hypothetical protein [Bifidobacterium callitrichos]KFI52533.1 hypothetical protein BCAL_1866 [Bifidobacterium callitrichos DSM 23973]
MSMVSFPIPVLGNGQGDERDVASEWRVGNFTFASGTEDVTIRFRVFNDDPDLKRLISEGAARIMAKWKCSSTISTGYLDLNPDTAHEDGTTYLSSIDQRSVLGPVTVSVFAVATRPIPDFRWSRQHDDYGDETFDVRTGDLLSVPTDFTFDPAKLYDPQNPPLNSIFKIVKDDKRTKGVSVSYIEDEQIIITLPKVLFNQMQLIDSANLKLSALVLPVLIDAIAFIRLNEAQGDEEDISERQWCKTIKRLMSANGLSDDDRPLTVAQRLLANPIDGYAADVAAQQENEEAQA